MLDPFTSIAITRFHVKQYQRHHLRPMFHVKHHEKILLPCQTIK